MPKGKMKFKFSKKPKGGDLTGASSTREFKPQQDYAANSLAKRNQKKPDSDAQLTDYGLNKQVGESAIGRGDATNKTRFATTGQNKIMDVKGKAEGNASFKASATEIATEKMPKEKAKSIATYQGGSKKIKLSGQAKLDSMTTAWNKQAKEATKDFENYKASEAKVKESHDRAENRNKATDDYYKKSGLESKYKPNPLTPRYSHTTAKRGVVTTDGITEYPNGRAYRPSDGAKGNIVKTTNVNERDVKIDGRKVTIEEKPVGDVKYQWDSYDESATKKTKKYAEGTSGIFAKKKKEPSEAIEPLETKKSSIAKAPRSSYTYANRPEKVSGIRETKETELLSTKESKLNTSSSSYSRPSSVSNSYTPNKEVESLESKKSSISSKSGYSNPSKVSGINNNTSIEPLETKASKLNVSSNKYSSPSKLSEAKPKKMGLFSKLKAKQEESYKQAEAIDAEDELATDGYMEPKESKSTVVQEKSFVGPKRTGLDAEIDSRQSEPVKSDSISDSKTKTSHNNGSLESVRKWQAKRGLKADGIWGKESEAAYKKEQSSKKMKLTPKTTAPTTKPAYDLGTHLGKKAVVESNTKNQEEKENAFYKASNKTHLASGVGKFADSDKFYPTKPTKAISSIYKGSNTFNNEVKNNPAYHKNPNAKSEPKEVKAKTYTNKKYAKNKYGKQNQI